MTRLSLSLDSIRKRELREARMAAGKCATCGKEPLILGQTQGVRCQQRRLLLVDRRPELSVWTAPGSFERNWRPVELAIQRAERVSA